MAHPPASGSVGLPGPIREFWNQVTTKNQVIIMVFQGSLGGHFCYPSSVQTQCSCQRRHHHLPHLIENYQLAGMIYRYLVSSSASQFLAERMLSRLCSQILPSSQYLHVTLESCPWPQQEGAVNTSNTKGD